MSMASRRVERRADGLRDGVSRWLLRNRGGFAVLAAFLAACAIGFAASAGLAVVY